MCANNILNLLPTELQSSIGSKIGDGIDGDVYSFNNDKVIKISKVDPDNASNFDNVLKYLKYNILCPYTYGFARVYSYGYLGHIQSYDCYYYISERLNHLSEDEWKVFHSIVSHEDRNIVKNYDDVKLKQILFGLARGLDFDEQKVIFFCAGLKKSRIKHLDLHPRNIMKDNRGYFKLIDFNRMEMENK